MNVKIAGAVCALIVLTTIAPRPAAAQPLDQLGNRASALGAFVAVADDASAVAWNPAGLINGPIFNILIDFGRTTAAPEPLVSGRTAGRSGHSMLALGVPPLGVSYLRGRLTRLTVPFPATGSAGESGSNRETRQVVVRSLVTSNLGVTVLQSVTDRLTLGATLKLVRGSLAVASTSVAGWNDAFDQADLLEGDGRTTADLDLGVMMSNGRMRAGIVARNLTAPTFESGPSTGMQMTLDRHVRAGVAWGDNWPGTASLIVALDADLMRVSHVRGDRRDIAAGAERWFRAQRFGARGGLRVSTVDEVRPVASAGGSFAVRSGMYVDMTAAWGRDNEARWNVSARLMY